MESTEILNLVFQTLKMQTKRNEINQQETIGLTQAGMKSNLLTEKGEGVKIFEEM